MTVRASVAVLAGLLIAVQIVRNAAVNALAGTRPAEAAKIWSGHPASEIGVAISGMAPAFRAGRPEFSEAFAQSTDAATKAPLAPEPFIVRGVQASLEGKITTAERAFEEAEWRDPRQLSNPQWLVPVIDTLIKGGDYAKARSVWARVGRADTRPGELLHDADFRDSNALPPFNWQLRNSTAGLAERQPHERLHILFYGDEDGTLASQLLLLSPGIYRMSMRLMGDSSRAHGLTWSLWCDKAAVPASSVALDTAAARGWQFEVLGGCSAQWLKLSGTSSDNPQRVDMSITGLTLRRLSLRA